MAAREGFLGAARGAWQAVALAEGASGVLPPRGGDPALAWGRGAPLSPAGALSEPEFSGSEALVLDLLLERLGCSFEAAGPLDRGAQELLEQVYGCRVGARRAARGAVLGGTPLQASRLLRLLERYLLGNMSCSNCLAVLALGVRSQSRRLTEGAMEYSQSHFVEAFHKAQASRRLPDLTLSTLQALVAGVPAKACSEGQKLRMLLQWSQSCNDEGHKWLHSMLGCLDYGKMSMKDLAKVMDNDPVVAACTDCARYLANEYLKQYSLASFF